MRQTNTLIIGASVSGLACAACLQKRGIEYKIIEKESQIAAPWHNHYDRLHLHTNKGLSTLPFIKFNKSVPCYPSRKQVIEYLDTYQKVFDICPDFDTCAESVKKEADYWITETNMGVIQSKYLIIATGPYGKPKPFQLKGLESFPGKIIHSSQYNTGRNFIDQKVLVVGFGNSACEIAIDLYEQGAMPSMSVRSPVNVIPRDIFGIPVLRLSLILSRFPPRVADLINAPLLRLMFGDLTKLGLRKMQYGVFEQIKRDGKIPLLDIGTIKHIREGHISVQNEIDYVEGKTVHFTDGRKDEFDSIVAAVGYYPGFTEFLKVEKDYLDDLKIRSDRRKSLGTDGIYFCGFRIGPTGVIREISRDAQKIAADIILREKLPMKR